MSHRYQDLVLFRDGPEKINYIEFFNSVLTSIGKPRSTLIKSICNAMIIFFINSFLLMTCLTGYNETNINRLLINYSPAISDEIDDEMIYTVIKKFKNLYWAKSHLLTWNHYQRFNLILSNQVPQQLVTVADIIIVVMFMQATEMIQINPIIYLGTLHGKPLVFKEVVSRYWFIRGLKYKEIHEFKFCHEDFFEKRKNKYLKQCSLLRTLPFKK